MTKLERDHLRLRALRSADQVGGLLNVEYRCDCCDVIYFERATFDRHRELMAPAFADWAEMKRAVWEQSRRNYRRLNPHIIKQQLKDRDA